DVENLPYLYSPVFALPFSIARYTGPVWIRRIWFLSLHGSFWLGFYLLLRKRPQNKSIAIMVILGTLLLFMGPYRSAAKWGQVTALLFFLVSIAMYQQRNSVLSGSVLSMIPLIKPALALPLFILRGKAWVFLTLTTITVILTTLGISGPEPWRQYSTALNYVSSSWNLAIPGNRSLTGNVHRIVGMYNKNYGAATPVIHEERVKRAAEERALFTVISASLMLVILATILLSIGQSRWRSFYLSKYLAPLLCWISLLISPLAYDHYGLFLLPLLIESIFIGSKRLYIPAVIAFSYWALIPNADSFTTNQILLLSTEAIRPALLVWVAIVYSRTVSAILLPKNCNTDDRLSMYQSELSVLSIR
ncbi:MAG: DUF2029 domain-containing protein, partial [Candidatus Sabulitectum sp.]|nr:DUF2029 domain-containing protein [Candidatus Sabulitectum sp.]